MTILGFLPRTRIGAFLGLATLLTALPLLTLPLMVLGKHGFVVYLQISDTYYRLPQLTLGSTHFARREFGMIPTSGVGYLLAAGVYVVLAFVLCWLVPLRNPEDRRPR